MLRTVTFSFSKSHVRSKKEKKQERENNQWKQLHYRNERSQLHGKRARSKTPENKYDPRLECARTAFTTPFVNIHREKGWVVSDCILTSTSFVLTPRNIISPIAHRHQVAISWSRHVQCRTKRFDFADSDQSNFVRGSPSPVFSSAGQIVSRSCSVHSSQLSRKISLFYFTLLSISLFSPC